MWRYPFLLIAVAILAAGCTKTEPKKSFEAPKTFSIGDGQIIKSVNYSPDGKWIIAGGENKRVKILDASTGNVAWVSGVMPDAVLAVAFSPDGKYFVATTGDNTQLTGEVVVYNTAARTERWGVKNLQNDVQLAKFSPDGKSLIVANHYNMTLYDLESGKQLKFFSGHPIEVPSPFGHFDAVTDLVFTKDPNVFITVSWDKKVLVWDIAQGHDVRTYSQGDPINACVLSPDQTHIVTGSAAAINIWNRATDRPDAIFSYDGEIRNLCVLDSSRYFVSGDDDGDLTLWKMSDYSRIREIRKAHKMGVWSVNASVDGRSFITSGGDGSVTQWSLDYILNMPPDSSVTKK